MFSRAEKTELAKGIASVLAGRERLPLDAEPVSMPAKPSVEGLAPPEAKKVIEKFESDQRIYLDFLLRRPGTLSSQEQAFLGRHIRAWSESGRPDE